jgi:hypothetical protein
MTDIIHYFYSLKAKMSSNFLIIVFKSLRIIEKVTLFQFMSTTEMKLLKSHFNRSSFSYVTIM